MMFHMTGTTPEAVSFFHSCGLDPASLQPSVQSERKEINGTPICPSLAQSSLIFPWMSHNTPLARYPFRIFQVSKFCHLLLGSTNCHFSRSFKKRKHKGKKKAERWSSEGKSSEEYSGRTNGRCRSPDCQVSEQFCWVLLSSGPNAPSCWDMSSQCCCALVS